MQASHTIFDRYHPAVALAYCGVLLVFSMAVMQLVYLLLTFCGLFALEASLCGAKASLRNLAWQAPLVMVLAIANPLFVSAGSTELFRIGMHAFYLESLVYGACQGLMLANVLLAFSVASHIVTSDKVLCTLGNLTPTLALMMSMTMRLVPQFARRGKDILATQKACTSIENAALDTAAARSACTAAAPHMPSINAAQAEALQPASLSQAAFSRSISFAQDEVPCNASRAQTGNSNAKSCPQECFAESCDRPGKSQEAPRTASAASPSESRKAPFVTRRLRPSRRQTMHNYLRLSTVLMGWGMEDSLETADAMRARGWGAAKKRTSYQCYRFRRQDALACIVLAAFALSAAASAFAACQQFTFYPRIGGVAPWFSYAPYALLVLLPAVAQLKESKA